MRMLQLLPLLFICFYVKNVSVPSCVSDGMVLQRGKSINLRGWATAGEKVKVVFIKKDCQHRHSEQITGRLFNNII